jgi:hypothetical protein
VRRRAGALEPRRRPPPRAAGKRRRPRLSGLCRGLPRHRLGRLDRPGRQPGAWRDGPADGAEHGGERDDVGRLPGAATEAAAVPGPDRGAGSPRQRRAEGAVPAETDLGRMVGHDEPDRAAGGLRRGRAAQQGRAAGRRHLCGDRPEDLHHLGRQRHHRQCLPPGAGPPARRGARHPRHLAVHGAQVPAGCRRQPGAGEQPAGGQPGTQAGHPRIARPA